MTVRLIALTLALAACGQPAARNDIDKNDKKTTDKNTST